MSRDLTAEEKQKFIALYGVGAACEKCGNTAVAVKIWEKYGSNAYQVGGDLDAKGIVGAVVACDACSHGHTVARSRILEVTG